VGVPDMRLLLKIINELASGIEPQIRLLLETKHLYQKLDIEPELVKFPSMIELATLMKSKDATDKLLAVKCYEIIFSDWIMQVPESGTHPQQTDNIVVKLPTIKIYCPICKDKEPFNSLSTNFMGFAINKSRGLETQTFFLEYLCQGCKENITIFMVNREKYKLSIVGRTPMETVAVPKSIPKSFDSYFSGAIVAHNSGETLAGLFLLRTFIEQYCLSLSAIKTLMANQVIENYMSKLPNSFTDVFPSLYDIYGKLSLAIHTANADADLFDSTVEQLTTHFDAKKISKIDDKTLFA